MTARRISISAIIILCVLLLATTFTLTTISGCATIFGTPTEEVTDQSPTQQWAHAQNMLNQVALQLENAWRSGAISSEEFLATKPAMVQAYAELNIAETLLPKGGEGFDVALDAAIRITQTLQHAAESKSGGGD